MHEYVKGVADCGCQDAEDHAPCLECGSSKNSYAHVGDSVASSVEIADSDSGDSLELS